MSTSGKSSIILRGGAVLVAILALATGYWLSDYLLGKHPKLSGIHGTVLGEPRDVQPFTLIDHTGKHFDNRSLQGRWSFVFFGYTHCPDVCPTTLSVLNSVAHKLEGLENQVQFVFISIDPERDTPGNLGQFVSSFNSTFIGATGTDETINALTRQLGVIYTRVTETSGSDDSGKDNYLMDHSASVLLFDPAGRFHAVFTPPLDATDMAIDFKLISEAYR
jgi:protein SCO1/2